MNVPGVDMAAEPWPHGPFVRRFTDEPMGPGAGPSGHMTHIFVS
jgi:hypothetical protein